MSHHKTISSLFILSLPEKSTVITFRKYTPEEMMITNNYIGLMDASIPDSKWNDLWIQWLKLHRSPYRYSSIMTNANLWKHCIIQLILILHQIRCMLVARPTALSQYKFIISNCWLLRFSVSSCSGVVAQVSLIYWSRLNGRKASKRGNVGLVMQQRL